MVKQTEIMPNGKAILYARVSSESQKKNGNGISSQLASSRSHGRIHNLKVVAEFKDEGISGKIAERPGIIATIARAKKEGAGTTIIIDEMSRLARNVAVHIELRLKIRSVDAILLCVKQNFSDDPEGELLELFTAATAQYERKNNTRRVLSRMQTRMEQGYWLFGIPFGYASKSDKLGEKVLRPDGYNATLVRNALEKFALGELERVADVQNYLNEMRIEETRNKKRGQKVYCSFQRASAIIRNAWFYAGFLEYEPWKISRRQGQHEPLISVATFQKIQDRLNNKTAPKYGKRSEDFPLRGIVECAACSKLMSSSWSGGRNNKYPYYHCTNPQCVFRGKIIRRELMHTQFEALLESLTPSPQILELTKAIMQDVWEQNIAEYGDRKKEWVKELSSIENDINDYIKDLRKAPDNVKDLLYAEIAKLQDRKTGIEAKLYAEPISATSLEQALGEAIHLGFKSVAYVADRGFG